MKSIDETATISIKLENDLKTEDTEKMIKILFHLSYLLWHWWIYLREWIGKEKVSKSMAHISTKSNVTKNKNRDENSKNKNLKYLTQNIILTIETQEIE